MVDFRVNQSLLYAVIEIFKSEPFDKWLRGLPDREAKARIEVRIRRLSLGNPGQHRMLPGGICELKVDHGPGYRVYYIRRDLRLILLLCGGDKSTQQRDIDLARQIADAWEVSK